LDSVVPEDSITKDCVESKVNAKDRNIDLTGSEITNSQNATDQARSQVLRFGGAKYIFRGARFLFLLYF